MLSNQITRIEDVPPLDSKRFDRIKKEKNLVESIDVLKMLVGTYPKVPNFSNKLAFLYEKNGDIKLAEEMYLTNRKNFPDDETIHITYGYFIQKYGDNQEEARLYFQTMVEKFPQSKYAYLGLSIALGDCLNLHEAIRMAKKAYQLDKNFDSAYSQIGHCFKQLAAHSQNEIDKKNYQTKASEYYQKALEKKPDRINKHKIIENKPSVNSTVVKIVKPLSKNSQPYSSQETNEATEFYSGKKLESIIDSENFIRSDYYKKTRPLIDQLLNINNESMVKPYLIKQWDEIKASTQAGDFSTATSELESLYKKLLFCSQPPVIPESHSSTLTEEEKALAWEELENIDNTKEQIPQSPPAPEQSKPPASPSNLCKFGLFLAVSATLTTGVVISNYLTYSK